MTSLDYLFFKRVALYGIGLAALCCAMPAMAVDAGQPAPNLTLPGVKGDIRLDDYKGKLVYLDFWASWCGPCKQSFPWMNEMQSKYGAKGLVVLAVNLDAKREDADKFLAQTPAGFTVAFDPKGETAKRYAIKGMPSSALIDGEGRLIVMHAGFREDERKALEEGINRALALK